ncbi:MAG: nuclear transport factor 2 family protein [Gammaproteobacteria bacterium]
MKKANFVCMLLIVSWLGSTNVFAATPSHPQDNTAWFLKTTQALYDVVAAGDKTVWDRILANDCIITTEDGDVLNRTEFLRGLKPLPLGFSGGIKIQDLTVRDLGNAAVAHYWMDEWEIVFGDKLRTRYVETDTYRRAGDTWKMVAAQTTVVPRDFQAVKVDTSGWPALVGSYRLGQKPGWLYHVYMRNGALYWGRDEKSTKLLIPLSPLVFFETGSIHTLVFVRNPEGVVSEVLQLHKYNEITIHRV